MLLFQNEISCYLRICGNFKEPLNFLYFPIAEFELNVKESYCTVAQLVPNTQYEFWVKAVNRAGVSSASERAVYMTGKWLFMLCFDLGKQ